MTGPALVGPVSRAAAFGVDVVLVAVGAVVTAALVEVTGHVTGIPVRVPGRPAFLVALPFLAAGYNVLWWTLTGRTPGQALFGLRVVTTAGGRVRWPAALVRAVVLVVLPVGALWCVVDRRRQAVHDKVARTLVVRR